MEIGRHIQMCHVTHPAEFPLDIQKYILTGL